ncbi:PREDICTED: uncharacterized protein LOC104603752 [Nelumbo nucifera]|uniref:Poly(A) polymerase I n=2 Tax=Nelumbo nucifera TaxID=4432 RepID=A0A822ZJB4_NELNU|nr:PREDICTED: uncharacterized protein LOC104603752 [Nelumbo nucifera]DAD41808.1 TPA_asm: hypothetical protein HUJ06_016131 [Nelumbo nucifera]
MAIPSRSSKFLYCMRILLSNVQKSNHILAGEGAKARLYGGVASDARAENSIFDISTSKAVDSRILGIKRSMISTSTWTVLKILQSKGFEAYLVGGCVRDLLLRRIPKDFDVITTATLKQIRKQFHRARIVGRRFPICLVHVQGSVIEISSFETVGEHVKENETVLFSQMSTSCDEKDFIRWRNCMHRDFTINSLFFDPFVNTIYDYANGMQDLRTCKVRTITPAQLSFQEDCARILRGLRIAARLHFSFSEETAEAIKNLSSSVMSLDKSRLMMEMNFMLSYGAAKSSLHLLKRFKLLDILLPFQAAYLAKQGNNQGAQDSTMLMRLFLNMDKLLACDRPSDCILWVGLLAFHLALVNNRQDALVVWTFSLLLYHGDWREAVKFARENAQMHIHFVPEISDAGATKSDDMLAEEVSYLASLIISSIDALTGTESLLKSMDRYPLSPCPGLVFISKSVGRHVAELFSVLKEDIESYTRERESLEINYKLLGKGDRNEVRFVLGKVIMDTMSSGVVQELRAVDEELVKEKHPQELMKKEKHWQEEAKDKDYHEAASKKGRGHGGVGKEKDNYHKEVAKEGKEIHKKKEKSCQKAAKEKYCHEAASKKGRRHGGVDKEKVNYHKEVAKEGKEIQQKEKSHQKASKEKKRHHEVAKEKEKHCKDSEKKEEDHCEATKENMAKCFPSSGLEQQEALQKEQEKNQAVVSKEKYRQPLSSFFE